MDFRITGLKLHWGRIPVKLRFSYGRVDTFPFVIVRVSAGRAEGLGETGVLPDQLPEGFPEDYVPRFIGRDSRSLDALLPSQISDSVRIFCEGISMALHDLVGKLYGAPVHVLLGGKKRNSVPLMPCVFPFDPDDAAQTARLFCERGFKRYMKVKLMGNLDEDLACVRKVRSVVPSQLVLQGDANEGYQTIEEARRATESLGAAGLNIIEDPLRGDVEEYCQLGKACRNGARIMTDALARKTSDLVRVLAAGAADVIGVHPDQPGSLVTALLHVKMARCFGVPVVLGGTGYTGVGVAAYQQLTAVALEDGPSGELGGFNDHGMPESLITAAPHIERGCAQISNLPGLGVTLDEEALARYQTGQRQWP